MKEFVQLISTVDTTNKTNTKIDALVHFFKTAPEKDRLWTIALFTGKRPSRPVNTKLMREWCREISQIPEWLFKESYSTTGDLGETLALLVPKPSVRIEKDLSQWMDELSMLRAKSEEEKKEYVTNSWRGLDKMERFIFNKLIGGSFRIGVSKKTIVNALVKLTNKDANQLMHSIMGKWHPDTISFDELINGSHIEYDNSKPYPFCLAYPLDAELDTLGPTKDWSVEYKWDGIRGQIVKRNGELYIWSRGEEIVTTQFPELVEVFSKWEQDFVIDGEILALKDSSILLFNDLQKRLNRKNVTKKLLQDVPVGFYIYDILEIDQQDIRELPFMSRRKVLTNLTEGKTIQNIKLSSLLPFEKWNEVASYREVAREHNAEGVMLKENNAPYHTGRKKGDWWKWKVDPLTIDVVMIYAQKGSGRRSSKYTDYTFAVRNGDELVTIAKAYSGLTNVEITEISRWVNQNATEKFGPVRTVPAELVFEIAFEGIALSNRHKSGVALRFPRIKRWRKDKTVADIDTIESVKALI